MLRDIEIQRSNPLLGIIAMMNGNDHKCTRVERGIYEIGHFNGDAHIPKEVLKDKYPTVEGVPEYGVCDDLANFMEKVGDQLEIDQRSFVVFMTPVLKSAQEPEGGWRWHKWEPYIGEHKPEAEYLYDEPFIEAVFCFSVYEVKG